MFQRILQRFVAVSLAASALTPTTKRCNQCGNEYNDNKGCNYCKQNVLFLLDNSKDDLKSISKYNTMSQNVISEIANREKQLNVFKQKSNEINAHGFAFETMHQLDFNLDAIMKGSSLRAISTDYDEKKPHHPVDIKIINKHDGSTVQENQLKCYSGDSAKNNLKSNLKKHSEKYKNQKVVINSDLSKNVDGEKIRDHIECNGVKSKPVSSDNAKNIKDFKKEKENALKTIKHERMNEFGENIAKSSFSGCVSGAGESIITDWLNGGKKEDIAINAITNGATGVCVSGISSFTKQIATEISKSENFGTFSGTAVVSVASDMMEGKDLKSVTVNVGINSTCSVVGNIASDAIADKIGGAVGDTLGGVTGGVIMGLGHAAKAWYDYQEGKIDEKERDIRAASAAAGSVACGAASSLAATTYCPAVSTLFGPVGPVIYLLCVSGSGITASHYAKAATREAMK